MEVELYTRLTDLLVGVNLANRRGKCPETVSAVTADSRRVVVGCCFVALVGTSVDGHDYIDKAIAAGAALIVHQYDLAH